MNAVVAPRRIGVGSGDAPKPTTKFTEGDISALRDMLLVAIPQGRKWGTMRGDVVRRLTNHEPLPPGCLVFVDWNHPPQQEEHKRSLVAGYKRFLECKRH